MKKGFYSVAFMFLATLISLTDAEATVFNGFDIQCDPSTNIQTFYPKFNTLQYNSHPSSEIIHESFILTPALKYSSIGRGGNFTLKQGESCKITVSEKGREHYMMCISDMGEPVELYYNGVPQEVRGDKVETTLPTNEADAVVRHDADGKIVFALVSPGATWEIKVDSKAKYLGCHYQTRDAQTHGWY